jgi:hypothetical protein
MTGLSDSAPELRTMLNTVDLLPSATADPDLIAL